MTNISISVTIASLSPLRNAQNINTSMMYCWIAMYNLTKDLIMIITLISYGQETLEHVKSTVKLFWVSSCFISHDRSKITHGPLQTWAGKEENPFDWHRDEVLLQELPAHAGNFPCHVPCD